MTTAADVLRFDDIMAAADRLAGRAVMTPLLEAPLLNELVGGRVLVKAEALQLTGSFKFRGALNGMSMIPPDKIGAGVVAYSSGNHAQGVAAAARYLKCPATIVMPADAPAMKLANTRSWGAETVLYDRFGEDREEIGARIQEERGAALIKPYDAVPTMAGQGTAALEAIAQAADRGAETIDAFLSPCGGGGLTAGCATVLRHLSPQTEIYACEPAAFDDTTRSLTQGERVRVPDGARSICDSLLAPTPGELTFAVNRERVTAGLSVSDDEAMGAMAAAFKYLKIVVEPGGATALASVLYRKFDARGKTAVVVCSGGNVDGEIFTRALTGPVPAFPD